MLQIILPSGFVQMLNKSRGRVESCGTPENRGLELELELPLYHLGPTLDGGREVPSQNARGIGHEIGIFAFISVKAYLVGGGGAFLAPQAACN